MTREELRAAVDQVQPFEPAEADRRRRMESREYSNHSYQHRGSDPDNCAACALRLKVPNYAGWILTYAAAGVPMGSRMKLALNEIEESKNRNPAYFQNILRTLATFRPYWLFGSSRGGE